VPIRVKSRLISPSTAEHAYAVRSDISTDGEHQVGRSVVRPVRRHALRPCGVGFRSCTSEGRRIWVRSVGHAARDGRGGRRRPELAEDDSGPVVKAVGRQINLWRAAAGLRQADPGAVIGYGGETVGAIGRGGGSPVRSSRTRSTKSWARPAGSLQRRRTWPRPGTRRRSGSGTAGRGRRSSYWPTTTQWWKGCCRLRST
jgi:hypothetical protein